MKHVAVAALSVTVLVVVLIDRTVTPHGLRHAGPLADQSGQSWVVRATPGSTFSDGSLLLDNRGESPVTIVSVTSLGGSGSLEFLGAKVVLPRRYLVSIDRVDGWPPRRRCPSQGRAMCLTTGVVRSAVGATITPTAHNWDTMPFELLLGYRVVSRQLAARDEVKVVYRYRGDLYEADWHAGVIACPPDRSELACSDVGGHLG